MLKNILLIIISSLGITCPNGKVQNDVKIFYHEFLKCEFKLIKKNTTVDFDLIYFDVKKIDSILHITQIIGDSSSILRKNLVKVLECMDVSRIKGNSFSCIYSIEYDDRETPLEDRDKVINDFKQKHGINTDPILFTITSVKSIR